VEEYGQDNARSFGVVSVGEKLKLKKGISLEEKASYITRRSEAGVLLFDYSGDHIYETNDTGSVIIKLCDGEHTKEDIIDALYEDYDAERSKIEEDIEEFFKKMGEYKLLSK
jgi:methyltransferase-like protein